MTSTIHNQITLSIRHLLSRRRKGKNEPWRTNKSRSVATYSAYFVAGRGSGAWLGGSLGKHLTTLDGAKCTWEKTLVFWVNRLMFICKSLRSGPAIGGGKPSKLCCQNETNLNNAEKNRIAEVMVFCFFHVQFGMINIESTNTIQERRSFMLTAKYQKNTAQRSWTRNTWSLHSC